MVEMDLDIKKVEQKKRKISDMLDEVNGQLLILKRRYYDLEKKNVRLRAAHVRKLTFSPQKNVKKDNSLELGFDEVDTDDLIIACKQAESTNVDTKV